MNKKVLAGVGIGGAIALVFGGKAIVSHVAAQEVDKFIESVSDVADLQYQNADVSLLGQGATVKDVEITPVGSSEPIKVEAFTVYDYKETDDIPTYVKMAIKGVSLTSDSLGDSAELFSELGYDKDLSANFSTEYNYDEAAKTVQLKRLKLGADDVGDIEMNFHFSNVSLDESAIEQMPLSLFGVEFHDAKISYKDDSFVNRFFETTAAAEGTTVEEIKSELVAGLEEELASGSSELSEEFVTEMKNFIDNPKSFSITFAPQDPVPLSSFINVNGPEDIIELLSDRFDS